MRRFLAAHPRLRLALVVAAAATLGLAVAYPAARSIRTTEAAWTDAEVVTGTLTTLKVNPVVTMGCAAPSGALNLLNPTVPIVWTAPAATADGIAPTSYVVSWSGAATVSPPSSAEVAAPTTSYNVPVSILTLGAKGTVTVTAKYAGTNWVAATAPSQGFTVTSLLLVTSYTCP